MTAEQIRTVSPERAILGAILSGWRGDPTDLGITSADFTDPNMGTVWETIRQHGPDPITVQRALADTPLRNRTMLVPELREEACVPGSVEYYAGLVARDADLRGLTACGQRIAQLGTLDRDPEELIEEARTLLDKAPRRATAELVSMSDVMAAAVERTEHPEVGVPWPWDVNDLLLPLAPGRLYVVGARPGIGKSLFGQGLAVDFARRGHRVAFASLEMSREELGQRMLAQVASVDLGRMLRGQVPEQDWERLSRAASHLNGLPILMDDTPSQTIAHVRRHARDVKRRGGLGLVVLDYLQIVVPRDRRTPRQEQVAEMSRALKLLARDLEVPVVAMAQVNRGSLQSADKRPNMGHLRESGAIEADADVVILLHQDPDLPGQLDVMVEKQRNGPKGVRPLMISGHYSRIE